MENELQGERHEGEGREIHCTVGEKEEGGKRQGRKSNMTKEADCHERRGLDIQRKVEKEEGVRKKGERGGRMNTGGGRRKKEG